ncbi:recombinase family protein [Bradyrhizobium sp. CB82]|uniref:recombinase family protein n=1 Tax=Bradyrhizobium sp. CB82 TaxID=3039159 RepID=UPI0024B17EF4|nr:recombinase family protein [Bradyrhizobium sp. CB82]WFU42559.1 recombinase family protein [Bradyrhizobium sp. CB82]
MSKHHHRDAKPLKAALYARYSSDLQKDTSIEDQFAMLEKAAKRLNLQLDRRHYYADRAVSGSSLFERPGLTRDLLVAAERGEFAAVLVEATDRLSRRKADMFWLADRFEFHRIRIFNMSGEVSDLQLLFEGHSNEDFIKKLAIRVKRGHDQAALKGRITTCAAYGYDCVEHQPGKRAINEQEAKIVRRIFTEYASGMTPRQIVAGLAKDKIPSPSGQPAWNYQGIVGGKGAKRGLLHNQLYIGKYVKNRFTAPKNPATGKREVRALDPEDLITVDMPDLRVISDELWNAAHAVRLKRQHEKFGASGYVKRATIPRKQGLLSGLIVCGACHGPMTVMASSRNGQRVGCSGALYRKTCTHTKSYDLNELTAGAIKHMHAHLTDPEFLKEKAKAKAVEAAKLAREEGDERRAAQKQLDRLNLQIKRLVDAIAECDGSVRELTDAIKAKEIERAALQERIRHLPGGNVMTLHPAALASFSRSVDLLHAKLIEDRADPEARLAFQNVVGSLVVHPTAPGAPYEISLYARYSAIESGIDLFPTKRTTEEVIANEGVRRIGTGRRNSSHRPSSSPSTGW